MSDKIKEAMETIKQAMIDDEPEVQGSYAHSWHCNIAMMCYDAMLSHDYSTHINHCFKISHEDAHKVGNETATRFMKLCFGVDTKR